LNTFENFTGNVAAAAAGRKAFEEQRQQLGEKLLKYLLRNIPSIDWLGSYSEDQIQTNLKTRNKQSSHKFSTQKYVFACSRLHPGGVCVCVCVKNTSILSICTPTEHGSMCGLLVNILR
jgi:hypothetical protein